jgi:hypothetical protein
VNEVLLPGLQCGSSWSAILVQVNGWQRSFQPSMKVSIAVMRSLTDLKVPRRMAWRVMIPNGDHVQPRSGGRGEVHGDPRVPGQPRLHGRVLVRGAVVGHDVQPDAGTGLGDLPQETRELLVPVTGEACVGDLAGGDLQGGEQRGRAVPDVAVGLLLGDPRPQRQDGRRPVQSLLIRGSET